MKHVYDILDVLRDELRSHPAVNTVSYGDITDLDLDKTTMFPLSHLLIDSASYGERTVTFSIKILCADIVDYNQSESQFDEFYGNDNLHDVMNTQFQVINSLIMKLRRGDLFKSNYQVTSTPSAEPFKESYGNVLAGWTTQVDIEIPNAIAICIESGSSSNNSSSNNNCISNNNGSSGSSGSVPVVTRPTTRFAQLDSQFSYQVIATNNPTSYSVFSPPEGLVIDESTGLISGVTTGDARLDSMSVKAANQYGESESVLIGIRMIEEDPTVLLPPDELTATDQGFDVSTGFEFRLGWNYPPYTGDITIIEIYRDGVLKRTETNTVGGSQQTATVRKNLSNVPTYSYTIRFGNSEGNFYEMSEPLLVDL